MLLILRLRVFHSVLRALSSSCPFENSSLHHGNLYLRSSLHTYQLLEKIYHLEFVSVTNLVTE
jgi:hypothetical protein